MTLRVEVEQRGALSRSVHWPDQFCRREKLDQWQQLTSRYDASRSRYAFFLSLNTIFPSCSCNSKGASGIGSWDMCLLEKRTLQQYGTTSRCDLDERTQACDLLFFRPAYDSSFCAQTAGSKIVLRCCSRHGQKGENLLHAPPDHTLQILVSAGHKVLFPKVMHVYSQVRQSPTVMLRRNWPKVVF